jgi:parallel beta-helix repeat protein
MIHGFFLNCTNPALRGRLGPTTSGSLQMLRKALLGLLLLLTQAGLVQAATYYVATTGNDSNAGTQGAPFRTIRKGISVIGAGDTLYIRGGSYPESINSATQTIPVGSSWSNAPLISAYPSETVTLRSVGLSASYIHYVIFQNLVIDNQQTTQEAVYIYQANHIRFIGCEIKNAIRQGVLMPHPGSDYNEFINCDVHHNGRTVNLDHGFYVASSFNLIEGCSIHDNAAFGVTIYNGYGERVNSNTVRGNRVYNNAQLGSGSGIGVASGTGNAVYNNVVWDHPVFGIEVAYGSPSNTMVHNNTVYNNAGAGIRISSDSTGAIVKNNIAYLGGITNLGSGTTLSNNLTTDPKFVNAAAADFHLQSASPAIDGGVTISSMTTDCDSVSRGNPPDIGAYEYRSNNQPMPAANLRIVSP